MKRGMTSRERRMLAFGGLAVILAAAWVLFFNPGLQEMDRLDRSIVRARREARTIRDLVSQFKQVNGETKKLMGRLSGRTADFSLAGELEDLIRASGLSNKLTSLRPLPDEEMPGGAVRVTADIQLEAAPFAALTKLLYRLEYSSRMLSVTRLSINTAESGVNASLRVLTLKPATAKSG